MTRKTVVLALIALVDMAGARAYGAQPAGTFTPPPPTPQQIAGQKIYEQRCASCHESGQERVPPGYLLRWLSVDHIERTLVSGPMQVQATGLERAEITSVAVYLSRYRNADAREVHPQPNPCKKPMAPMSPGERDWHVWGHDVGNSRHQPTPGFTAAQVPQLKVKWAWAYPGQYAQGQPILVGGNVLVGSSIGRVTALDAGTGCEHWTYDGGVGAKSAVVVGTLPDGRHLAFYGDEKSTAHAIDTRTGKGVWKVKIDDHPISRVTGTPTYFEGRLYVPVSSYEEGAGSDPKYPCCTFRGNIVALDAATGKVLWKNYSIVTPLKPFRVNSAGTQMYGPAGGAIWSSPTVDKQRRMIYAATGNSYTDVDDVGADAIVAFDMDSGERKWVNQITAGDSYLVRCANEFEGKGNCPTKAGPDHDFGGPPILKTLPGGKRILLGSQKSGQVSALDPDDGGKILWQTQVGRGSALGGIEHGSAADDRHIYVPVSDVIGGKDALPGLNALDLVTGKLKWRVSTPELQCSWGTDRCRRAQSAAATVIPGVAFSGAWDGHLRAYSVDDGKILWDFDTAAAPMKTVNGLSARGGSIDGGGATIAHGMLFVNSGYGNFAYGGRLLLAFSIDGK